MVPSMDKVVAVFVSFWLLANAAGHPEWVWKWIAVMRYHALKEIRKLWGCPSLTRQSACTSYDPARYR